MRFNKSEVSSLASQPSDKFDKEGVLFVRERQEGFFRRTEGKEYCETIFKAIFTYLENPYVDKNKGVFLNLCIWFLEPESSSSRLLSAHSNKKQKSPKERKGATKSGGGGSARLLCYGGSGRGKIYSADRTKKATARRASTVVAQHDTFAHTFALGGRSPGWSRRWWRRRVMVAPWGLFPRSKLLQTIFPLFPQLPRHESCSGPFLFFFQCTCGCGSVKSTSSV